MHIIMKRSPLRFETNQFFLIWMNNHHLWQSSQFKFSVLLEFALASVQADCGSPMFFISEISGIWLLFTLNQTNQTKLKNQAWSFSISLLRIWQFLLCKAQMIYAVKFCLSLLITWLLCRKLLDGVFLAVPDLAGTIKSGRAKLRVWDFSTELVWTLWLYSEGWSCYQLL